MQQTSPSSGQGLNQEDMKSWIQDYLGEDFPGDLVVKNLTCNAEDLGSILGCGTKITHASEQLSPCTTRVHAPQ